MNIEFQQCTLPHQVAQVHVINHPVRTFQRKSPSTLGRDRIRQEKYMKKMACQSLQSHERQISDHSVNLNVHLAECKPKTVPLHNPKPDEYDWPFTSCETSEILHTMDHVDILKTDLIQTKSHLQSVTKVLETFKCWLQQKKFCTKFSCVWTVKGIQDLGWELQESQRRRPAKHDQDARYHDAKGPSGYQPHQAYGYHGHRNAIRTIDMNTGNKWQSRIWWISAKMKA